MKTALYMQNTGLKVWKSKTPVLHINSAAHTRIAFLNQSLTSFSPRPSSLKILKLVMAAE